MISSRAALAMARHRPTAVTEWTELSRDDMKSAAMDDSIRNETLLNCVRATLECQSLTTQQYGQISYDCEMVRETAAKSGDVRLESQALEYLGHADELTGHFQSGLDLTRSALSLAIRLDSPERLYRLQWQKARLLKAEGRNNDAIDMYEASIKTLQPIRFTLAASLSAEDSHWSFQDEFGGLFTDLEDLLLQRAGGRFVDDLLTARRTAEELKSAQLEAYFRDDCISIVKARERNIDQVVAMPAAGGTAVVYFLPLKDRLEILVRFPDRLQRYTSQVSLQELRAQTQALRRALEFPQPEEIPLISEKAPFIPSSEPSTNAATQQRGEGGSAPRGIRVISATEHSADYRASARRLYDWLIRPLESDLQRRSTQTLVFVLSGPLQSIPMSVLNDGHDVLVSHYALALSPGLTLMEPSQLTGRQTKVLVAGISNPPAGSGIPDLPYVAREVQEVGSLMSGTVLLNKSFVTSTFARDLERTDYTIVHVASHGHFGANSSDAYIMAYGEKITLDRLQSIIMPNQFRDQPIELLVLSACETASGDENSALGLAGIALKSGARSALATLWPVDDKAAYELVIGFYRYVHGHPNASRAEALRQAQLQMMQRYPDPAYWSGFLLIGNWF